MLPVTGKDRATAPTATRSNASCQAEKGASRLLACIYTPAGGIGA